MDLLERSLKKAFINFKEPGSHYDPQLIINQPDKKEFLLNSIQDETEKCLSFIFSIAFVTQDGLNALKTYLSDLNQRGIRGRLITSTYLQFNHPEVFESLMKVPNLDVRISTKKGFHAKGYLFEHEDYYSFIIGSSNLTMSALKMNYEWNVKLTSYNHGEIIHQMKNHLEEQWEQGIPLTKEWIRDYRLTYKPQEFLNIPEIQEAPLKENYIVPNTMQVAALESLKNLRDSGERRGLVVSATGTGKTYLAAFDVRNANPKKMLFIVHREQILKDAMESFYKVIGGSSGDYGILSGNRKDLKAKYLFATIQTISKPAYHELFEKDEFDYILIDEVHKAGANSYLRTIDYFQPKFLLGLTATPERTDNINIYEIFDYNIAYEIRLQEAMEEDLLCPFHYFGVTDFEKDGEVINETSELKYLVNDERVKLLLEKLDYYGASHNKVRGLVFCSRKDETKELSDKFNAFGVPSAYLTGDHSVEERERQIERLENDEIDYIFTVDIFNEGIDIPKVNQVVMLRNTQSSIIFIQQLGRGLRKHKSKEFVTVIDFIGNYKNSYMIPMAFSGDLTSDKTRLEQDTYESQYISGLSTINFEAVAKERIFQSINQLKPESMKVLRDEYKNLKKQLNRVPNLSDFRKFKIMDPLIITKVTGSYYRFLTRVKDNKEILSEKQDQYLYFLSQEVLPGLRMHEIILLNYIIENKLETFTYKDIKKLFKNTNLLNSQKIINSVLKTLSVDHYVASFRKKYMPGRIISFEKDYFRVEPAFLDALSNEYFYSLLMDLLYTAELLGEEYDKLHSLTKYKKYSRREALRMVGWDQQQVDINVGGYIRNDEIKQFLIFITLHKDETFKSAEIAYANKFITPSLLYWQTRNNVKISSPDVKVLENSETWNIHIFVKKINEEKQFIYLGEVKPILNTIKPKKVKSKESVESELIEMDFKFIEPIERKVYNYLTKI